MVKTENDISELISKVEDLTKENNELKERIAQTAITTHSTGTAVYLNDEDSRSLILDMKIGVILQGPKAEIILSNPKALELLGISEDQLLGKTSFDPDWNVIHEDGSPFPGETHPVPQAIETRKPVTNVMMGVYRPLTGDRVWLLVDAIPQYNVDGSVKRVICTFNDITERKRITEALIESEERLARAEKNAKIGNWKLLLNTREIISSKGASIIYGVDDTSLSLEEVQKIPLPEYRAALDKALIDLVKANIPYNIEYKIKRINDGEILDIHSIAEYDKESNIIFGVVHDITEQKKISDDLLRRQEELDNYFNNALDLFCIASVEGEFLKLNREWEYALGYKLEELIGKKFLDYVHPDDVGATIIALKDLSENKPVFNFSNRYRRRDGSYRILEWRSKLTSNLIFAAARDITERVTIESALRESEERYRLISDNTADVIWILNPFTKMFKYVSPTVVKMRGYTDQETMAQPVEAVMTPESQKIVEKSLRDNVKKFLETESTDFYVLLELDQTHKNGSIVHTEVISTYLRNKNGEVEIVGVTRDITGRKKAEEEIKLKNETLQKLISEKDKFFSIIAHDLRSPFEGLIQLTEYMANGSQDFTIAEFTRVSKLLNQSAINVFKLIDNLLEWSLIQQGKMNVDIQKLNLRGIAAANIEIFAGKGDQKNISLNNLVDESLCVAADEKMVNSIFRNLLSNAIKFTNKNGSVTISTDLIDDNKIRINISDTGIGMNEKLCEKLFKIEEKVGRLGTEGESSSGLGLVLCKEFVEKLGGKIWVTSAEGKGTDFYFTLPAAT